MTRVAVVSVVLVVGVAGPAPAQRVVGYRVVGYAGGLPPGPFWAPPPVWGGWGWPPAFGLGVGYGPGFGGPFFGPPVVVVNPPPVIVIGFNAPADRPDPDAVLPKRDPDEPGRRLVRAPRPGPLPPPKVDPFAPPAPLGPVEVPEADPAAEAARQVKLARAAFAAAAYGRAAEHSAAATRARPDDPLPYFLTAQARFAGGRYTDAVTAIREGMRRSPDWPTADFKPKELYGVNPGRFDDHLVALRAAVAANPRAAALRFLLAHQLWFGGDRAEAARLFRAVAAEVRDPTEAERFIRVVDKK